MWLLYTYIPGVGCPLISTISISESIGELYRMKKVLFVILVLVPTWLMRGLIDNSFIRLLYTLFVVPLMVGGVLGWLMLQKAEDDSKARPDKLKKHIEPVIESMYRNGKTDADVYWYLKKQMQALPHKGDALTQEDRQVAYFWYSPYISSSHMESLPSGDLHNTSHLAKEFKNRMKSNYSQAYSHRVYSLDISITEDKNYSEFLDECYRDFAETACTIATRFWQQYGEVYSPGSSTNNHIDWEKAATGTTIFGPTGVALGMMDDENKH